MGLKTEASVNSAYTSTRPDIMSMVPLEGNEKILDVGCSTGRLGEALLAIFPDLYVLGIDGDAHSLELASKRLSDVRLADLNVVNDLKDIGHFDVVIMADVLEHLLSPIDFLTFIKSRLKEGGKIVVSLPNVQHITVIMNLLLGRWPERDRGIFDKTHIKFFTRHSAIRMLVDSGFTLEVVKSRYRLFDQAGGFWNRIIKRARWLPFSSFLSYQYIFLARVSQGSEGLKSEF